MLLPTLTILSSLSLAAWLYLLLARHRFWRMELELPMAPPAPLAERSVAVVVPARNEGAILPKTLPSLAAQDYGGQLAIFVVDDESDDDTRAVAEELALRARLPVEVVPGAPRPLGWSGKVWAMEQGRRAVLAHAPNGAFDYILFTDADILHPPESLAHLVAFAEEGGYDLVSLMVRLPTTTFWERLLLPAFVFFFAKLYPFPAVADPKAPVAAAAGGCLLVRRHLLDRDGLRPIAAAVIDDIALARHLKERGAHLFLGLGPRLTSIRSYRGLSEIWHMVARSAYAELRYSVPLLAGTVVGMLLLYVLPPLALLAGAWALRSAPPHTALSASVASLLLGGTASSLAALAYRPTVRWYRLRSTWALSLPLAALLYTAMTLDSARRHLTGDTPSWRGRRLSQRREAAVRPADSP